MTAPTCRCRQPEPLLTVAEVAALWRCAKGTVYSLISSGELRSVDLGVGRAKTRVPASAANEFQAAHTRGRNEPQRHHRPVHSSAATRTEVAA